MRKGEERALLLRALSVLADRDLRRLPARLAEPREGDAGKLTAWIHGALRHRRSLRALIGGAARRALKGCTDQLVASLELGAFRVVWGEEPARVVAAELSAFQGRKGAAHLLRVLGAVESEIAERTGPAEGTDDVLPLDRRRAVRLRHPLLAVSGRRPAARLGILHSLPDELVEAWIARRGEELAAELCRAANDPPPLFARTNPLRTAPGTLQAALAAEGVGAALVEGTPGALRIESGRGKFRRTAAWREGLFTIQDLTAQEAARALAPVPGEPLLDLCAAPGTKTTALAELALDKAPIVACDRSPRRLARVEENARRLGLSSISTRVTDARRPDALAGLGPFPAILADAPCSNTGVLRRRPEARWRYDPKSQRRLARDQGLIIRTAARLLAPGGRLLWSVCALEPEEGEELVRALLAERPGLRLEVERTFFPGPGGGDGGYQALIRRSGEA